MTDLATVLSGIEPEQTHFEVVDTDGALWCVNHITEANKRRAAIEAQYKTWKAKLDEWRDKELMDIERTEEHMIALLQPWATREIARERGKHIDLPGVRVSYRSLPSKVSIDDEEAVIEWAADYAPEILRVKTEVSKSELKKRLAKDSIPGARLEPGHERLYVEER